MEGGFHTTGAAGFLGAEGVVEPDVATGDEVAADVDVVVLDQNDAALEGGLLGEAINFLGELPAAIVLGVGLAGEENLDRAFFDWRGFWRGVWRSGRSGGAFIGGESAGEADGQDRLRGEDRGS